MSDQETSDYLVISRGKWDADATADEIQKAIDVFYPWIEANIAKGRMKPGSRLKREGATVSREGIVTDGPYGETKELIGGYWIIVARSLDEAAKLAAENPCMQLGLFYEIRPLDAENATGTMRMTETPGD